MVPLQRFPHLSGVTSDDKTPVSRAFRGTSSRDFNPSKQQVSSTLSLKSTPRAVGITKSQTTMQDISFGVEPAGKRNKILANGQFVSRIEPIWLIQITETSKKILGSPVHSSVANLANKPLEWSSWTALRCISRLGRVLRLLGLSWRWFQSANGQVAYLSSYYLLVQFKIRYGEYYRGWSE